MGRPSSPDTALARLRRACGRARGFSSLFPFCLRPTSLLPRPPVLPVATGEGLQGEARPGLVHRAAAGEARDAQEAARHRRQGAPLCSRRLSNSLFRFPCSCITTATTASQLLCASTADREVQPACAEPAAYLPSLRSIANQLRAQVASAKLLSPTDQNTRPMMSMVKGAVFSMLTVRAPSSYRGPCSSLSTLLPHCASSRITLAHPSHSPSPHPIPKPPPTTTTEHRLRRRRHLRRVPPRPPLARPLCGHRRRRHRGAQPRHRGGALRGAGPVGAPRDWCPLRLRRRLMRCENASRRRPLPLLDGCGSFSPW